jgi:hypothetical protein
MKRVLNSIVQKGGAPNFIGIAHDQSSHEILQILKKAYGNCLYDAVTDAGFSPEQVFLRAKGYSFKDLVAAVKWLKVNLPKRLLMVDQLADAVALEFPLEDMPLAKEAVMDLFENIVIPPSEKADHLYALLQRNKTLLTYLELR